MHLDQMNGLTNVYLEYETEFVFIYFFCYFCSDVVVFWILDMLLLSNAAAFVG